MKATVYGCALVVSVAPALGAPASSSKITYQGQLTLNGEKVNQPCNFCFSLWDAPVGGAQVGSEICEPALPVEAGVFTTMLDFGTRHLQSHPLWLDITADCTGEEILLRPRQQITAAPFALHTRGIEIDPNNNASVDGVIESTIGGFKFPDGTTMTSKNDVVNRVTVGPGLTGGGTGGEVALRVAFPGTGTLNGSEDACARRDHRHSRLAASDGSPAEALIVDSAGKVGIGQSTPIAFVDINAGNAVNPPPGVRVSQADNQLLVVGAGATFAGGIGVNNALTSQGSMNFQKRTTAGAWDSNSFNLMSLFFSDNHMMVYGPPYRWDNNSQWSTVSDRRLKKNIQPLTRPLDRLLHLQGMSFEFIESNSPPLPAGTHTGFVAQDVEKVFPEWVSENADGYKAVTVSGFEALTVESLRQLRDEKDAEIAAMKSRIEKLEQMVEAVTASKRSE